MSKIKLGREGTYGEMFYADVDNFRINLEIRNGEVHLRNLVLNGFKIREIESKLAKLRGFFAHSENIDKALRLIGKDKPKGPFGYTSTSTSLYDAYRGYFRDDNQNGGENNVV